MRLVFATLLLLSACSFDTSTMSSGANGPGDDAAQDTADARSFLDASPADALTTCLPNEQYCVDDTLQTCLADGTGLDPGQIEQCGFACLDNDHCISASNLSQTEVAQCDGMFVPLAPGADSKLLLANNAGTPEIQCNPDCGDGSTQVITAQATIPQSGAADLAMFCLSILELPDGAEMNVEANLPWAVALVVDGSATVAGLINIGGGSANASTAGFAGPGGGRGGPLHDAPAADGEGSCAGLGGVTGGQSGDRIGGGGGGGGFADTGGDGGRGQAGNNGDTGAGGAGGGSCGTNELIPLFAGSGGGSGGDGTGGTVGWPGGGGAGALQISSKISLTMAGTILANGGLGFSDLGQGAAGGSGGGSGGGVLLEAPILTLTGSIEVDGGDGADGTAGSGGDGATSSELSGSNGTDENGSNESGAGGGGGGGRVRLNASLAPVCSKITPSSACTAGVVASP